MAKASRCYTGGKQAVGTPTLNRNQYMQLMKTIRKVREEHGAVKLRCTEISAD